MCTVCWKELRRDSEGDVDEVLGPREEFVGKERDESSPDKKAKDRQKARDL